MDMQAIYPPAIVPRFMTALENWYVENYHDQFFVTKPAFFRAFIASELLYQAPVMIIALRLLRQSMSIRAFVSPDDGKALLLDLRSRTNHDPDSPKVPLLLLPYAMLIFATTATCMFDMSSWNVPLEHKINLATLYAPYLAICMSSPTPLAMDILNSADVGSAAFMLVDMSIRLNNVINEATRLSVSSTKKLQ